MTKILVYGDSYASSENDQYDAWPDMLQKKLGLLTINRAISGSSTEYAMQCLIKDINDGTFKEDDIIVFVTSTPGRFDFQFQKGRPETASQYWHKVDEKDPKHEWYRTNKKYIEWYMINSDNRMKAINHECYLHALKNIAESNPKCKIVQLANSDHTLWTDPISIPMGKIPKNFLSPDIFLTTVSENEIIGDGSYSSWTQHTGWDPRLNHMCNLNLDILSDMVITALETNKIDHFNYDKFEKNIYKPITTKKEYLSLIGRGLLCRLSGIESNLPG